jgi:hypothetical protein
VWSRQYSALGSDCFENVIGCGEGGFLFMGETHDTMAGIWRDWLVRTDDTGDTLWTRTYAPYLQSSGAFYGAVQLSDRGFALAAGFAAPGVPGQFALARTDSMGVIQWFRTYGGAGVDCPFAVCRTRDSGFILAGQTSSFGHGWFDAWLVKTDSAGNMQWSRTFGGGDWDQANDAMVCPDGGFILTGMTSRPLDYLYLVRTDSTGSAWVCDDAGPSPGLRDDKVTLSVQPSVLTGHRVSASYFVPTSGPVEVAVYDVNGRWMAILSSRCRARGSYQEDFTLPRLQGVVYMRISAPTGSAARKLVLAGP